MTTTLTDGHVGKRLAAFTFPLLLSNLLQQLYSAADSIIVGRLISGDALAAVGASHPIIVLLVALMSGLCAGTEIIIARRIGEKNEQGAKETLDSMMTVILLFAVLTTVVGYYGSEFLLSLIGTPAEIMAEAVTYLQYFFLGMVGVAGYNILTGAIRSAGNSVIPLVVLGISAVLNIVLDLIFVGLFSWGIAGAAVATVASQSAAFLWCMFYVNMKEGMLRYNPFRLTIRAKAIAEGFGCGIPCSVQQCTNSFGMIVLQIAVNSLGTQAVTAYTIGSKIDSFAGLPIMGLGQALCIFTSQNLGAGKPERVAEGKRFSILCAYGVCLMLLVLFWIFGPWIAGLFCDDDPVAVSMAVDYIRILSLAYFFVSYWTVMHGFIRGTKDTLMPMIIALIGNWGFRIPMAYILKEFLAETGVWLSIPCGWFMGFVLTWLYLKSGWFARKYEQQLQTEGGANDDTVE